MRAFLSLLIFCVSIFISCKKEAPDNKYQGYWRYLSNSGNTYETLDMTDLKNSVWQICTYDPYGGTCFGKCYSCEEDVKSKAFIKDGKLHIGVQKWKVDQEPTISGDGMMQMILDGKLFVKEAEGSCNDGFKNQNETNVDCGGVCQTCPSCNDSELNQNETSIDCGGACGSCFESFYYEFNLPAGGGLQTDTVEVFDYAYQKEGSIHISVNHRYAAYSSLNLVFTPTGPGTYPLIEGTQFSPGSSIECVPINNPVIEITALDTVNKRISGKFDFLSRSYAFGNYRCDGAFVNVKYYRYKSL